MITSRPAVSLRNLSISYGGGRGRFTAVHEVDLELPVQGTLGLVGESGSGKSTLGRAVAGLHTPSSGEITTTGGVTTRIGMVFQNPRASFNPRMTVHRALLEAWETVPEADRQYVRKEAGERALASVGIGPEALARYPHEFSGGQLQRIAIARALAAQPDVVVLDEVTSALDVGVQATILQLLREVQANLGLTYLFISHDLAVVAQMSDVVAVLYVGRLLEVGTVQDVFQAPHHPYTQALLESAPRLGVPVAEASGPTDTEIPDPRDPPSGCPYWSRCAVGPLVHPERSICRTDPPPPVPRRGLGGTAFAACHFAVDSTEPNSSEGEHLP